MISNEHEIRLREMLLYYEQGGENCITGAAALRWAFERIAKLESYLETTADGVLVREAEILYCPKCGQEIPEENQQFDIVYCWNCTNPDCLNEVPLPLLYASCLAKPKEAA